MLIRSTTLLALFFAFFSSFVYSMEDPNDNWIPEPKLQPLSLKQIIINKLAYEAYNKTLYKPKKIKNYVTLPEVPKEQYYNPFILQIYSNLVKNNITHKPFFNYKNENNLILQLNEEKALPKKITKLFSNNLKAKESYIDTIKFWLNLTDFKHEINSITNDSFAWLQTSCMATGYLLGALWDGYTKPNAILTKKLNKADFLLISIYGIPIVYLRHLNLVRHNISEHQPRQIKRLKLQKVIASSIYTISMALLILKLVKHAEILIKQKSIRNALSSI